MVPQLKLVDVAEENWVERVLSNLFPPKFDGTVSLEHSEYHERMARRGIENHPKMWTGVIVKS